VTRRGSARSARLAAALATLATGLWAGARANAARGTVALDTAACPAISEAAIRRIVGIEIGDLLAAPGDAPADGSSRLAMICDDDGAARLQVRGAGRDQPVERQLRLADFPGDAAPRALALAGIEMLAALDPAVRERIQIRQSPAAPSAPPPSPPPAPPNAADSVAPVGIAISAVRREFLGAGSAGGWGGRLDLDRALVAPFALGLDVEIDGAGTTVALGEARALIVSAGAFGGLRAAGARVAGSLSLGARFGLAALEGTPAGGSGASGGRALRPWWGPALAGRGWIRAGAIGIAVTLEAGLVARGAQGLADGATILAVDGAWLATGIGVRF
jgi:hypothetical protein